MLTFSSPPVAISASSGGAIGAEGLTWAACESGGFPLSEIKALKKTTKNSTSQKFGGKVISGSLCWPYFIDEVSPLFSNDFNRLRFCLSIWPSRKKLSFSDFLSRIDKGDYFIMLAWSWLAEVTKNFPLTSISDCNARLHPEVGSFHWMDNYPHMCVRISDDPFHELPLRNPSVIARRGNYDFYAEIGRR
jgi:hypothetical protein